MKKKISKLMAIFLSVVVLLGSVLLGGCSAYIHIAVMDDGDARVNSCKWYAVGHIEIPETYFGYPVTDISSMSFEDCHYIKSVTIPDSVKEIGRNAFDGCFDLVKVNIGRGILEIADDAFDNCPRLVIHGYAGTVAETFAEENGIPFVAR